MTNLAFLDIVQTLIFFAVLLICVPILGSHMAKVYGGNRNTLTPELGWLERLIYKLSGIDPAQEMTWKAYAFNVIVFSMLSFGLLYGLLSFQTALPINPANMPEMAPHLVFNTAVSFITNTNWQSYGGETTLSYFSQMAGLAVQNFLSAAVGMAVAVAFIRGLTRKNTPTLGNFWADLVRGTLYILLPLSMLLALLLVSQGVVQTFKPYIQAELLEPLRDGDGKTVTTQTLAVGPAASQIAIKQLGTNGGGFFNVNSAHPFENPTPFSNFLEMLAILLIPASLCYTFGKMVNDTKQGWAILAAMTAIFIPFLLFCTSAESSGNPVFEQWGIEQSAGNMEGKEVRLGVVNSTLWATATTAASNGSVNSMHASYTPLGGMAPMLLMQFGEVIYGGVGSGLYGMLIFVLLTVFIAGLMVGRTPEYLGKKVQAFEIKMASIAILVPSLFVLGGSAVAVLSDLAKAGLLNSGSAGFSEILYAFTSASNNNGSAFAGLTANAPFYNTALGVAMLFGRFFVLLPVLAIAGSFAAKNVVPPSAGTLPTHTPLFVAFLVGVVVMVGVLTYVPALALGPVAEHFNLMSKVAE